MRCAPGSCGLAGAAATLTILISLVASNATRRESGREATVSSPIGRLDSFRPPVREDQVLSALGNPTHVEARARGTLWTYEHPFSGITQLQVRLGERGRATAIAFTSARSAPSLLTPIFGSRCSGWGASHATVWCFLPQAQ
jgi:hypothetical protein